MDLCTVRTALEYVHTQNKRNVFIMHRVIAFEKAEIENVDFVFAISKVHAFEEFQFCAEIVFLH